MPTRMTRSLALASMAALPLTLGVAWAQTDSEPEEGAATESGTAAETGTAAGTAETETQSGSSMSTGPKRVRVPGAGETAGETDEAAGGMQTEDVVVQSAEPAEETEAEGTAAEGDSAEPAQNDVGTGPFVGDFTLGDPDAPVQVVEYASFTCPHCAAYHEAAWEDLKSEYIDADRIGFTLREVYFDRYGLWASMAARCGGEQGFYPMADQFLSKQAEWTQGEDIAQAIAGIARRNGLAEGQIKACLENQEFAKLLVDEFKQSSEADEVTSTPTFLIISPDGTERVVGNKPDEVREAIEAALPAG